MTRFRFHIAAVYNTQPQQPMFMVVGPVLQPTTPPDVCKTILAGLTEEALLRLADVHSQSLPSLPEKQDGEALSTARQWLSLVEAGKAGAAVSVWENEQGRHILIRTRPE